jgi:hypothetical protein
MLEAWMPKQACMDKTTGQNEWIILHSSAARRVKYMDVWSAYLAQLCYPKG